MLKSILQALKKIFFGIIIIIATIIIVRAFDALKMPDLDRWHTERLESEFQADKAGADTTFEDYLRIESRLFKEVSRKVVERISETDKYRLNRYFPSGLNNSLSFEHNWNRSYERIPPIIEGGALLLHGLTDSPYSLRKVASILKRENFYVLGLRLPGHGTIPAGIASASWQDWMAAVKIGVRHVVKQTGGEKPFIMVGYSNGGALSLKYTLDAIENTRLTMPDRLILFSPAVGVTPFGFFANWHKALSFIPFFEKFKWEDILPEYDPYKYNSFPKHAGLQTYQLTKVVQAQIENLKKKGLLSRFPPTLSFQSLVDATVSTRATVDRLYNKLEQPHHELVLFDINRLAEMKLFLKTDHDKLLDDLNQRTDLPYRLTVITNENENSLAVAEKTKAPGSGSISSAPIGLRWPQGVYSLSHVAIPYPIDDPLYGQHDSNADSHGMNLGAFEPHGERGVLSVSMDQLMRLRHNPFFPYIEQRIVNTVKSN
jgi:alpha-beta hydrolase superfamily lysophospholipase